MDFNDLPPLPTPKLRKFPTFPVNPKWAAFCSFLYKVVSGGGQVVRRSSYTLVNLVEISSASFHNVPISFATGNGLSGTILC